MAYYNNCSIQHQNVIMIYMSVDCMFAYSLEERYIVNKRYVLGYPFPKLSPFHVHENTLFSALAKWLGVFTKHMFLFS
jgi:hypothetical protein